MSSTLNVCNRPQKDSSIRALAKTIGVSWLRSALAVFCKNESLLVAGLTRLLIYINIMKVFSHTLLFIVVVIHALKCAAVLGLETAFVEVVTYEQSGGDYTTYTYKLKGHFSDAGAATSAEGDILEVNTRYATVILHAVSRG